MSTATTTEATPAAEPGAVGAIERSQGPFLSWARDTAIVLPVFALAMIWAFTRAHRKYGLTTKAPRSPLKLLTTALLIVAAGTSVGVAETVVSGAYDFHLQSNLLASTAGLHDHGSSGSAVGTNPAYANEVKSAFGCRARRSHRSSLLGIGPVGAGLSTT